MYCRATTKFPKQTGSADNSKGVLDTTNQNECECATLLDQKDTVTFHVKARHPCKASMVNTNAKVFLYRRRAAKISRSMASSS